MNSGTFSGAIVSSSKTKKPGRAENIVVAVQLTVLLVLDAVTLVIAAVKESFAGVLGASLVALAALVYTLRNIPD
jgi:hypothetical protein